MWPELHAGTNFNHYWNVGTLTWDKGTQPTASGGSGLTDAELRASALAVTGPLTDAQLRALALAVSGPITDAQLRALAVAVSGPVTDAQLRASAINVIPNDSAATTVVGTLTAVNQTVEISCGTKRSVRIELNLGWTGSMIFQASYNGADWVSIDVWTGAGTINTLTSPGSAQGLWVACAGAQKIRVKANSAWTGTTNVTLTGLDLPIAVTKPLMTLASGNSTNGSANVENGSFALRVTSYNNIGADSKGVTNADTQGSSSSAIYPEVACRLFGYNGASWDRLRATIANGLAVDVTRVTGTVTTKELRSATATVTAVADNAASVSLLALNANRLGAIITNDSSAALYVKLGATASLTSYTVRLQQYSTYEVPAGYTGAIDGIWATDPNDGSARITELT